MSSADTMRLAAASLGLALLCGAAVPPSATAAFIPSSVPSSLSSSSAAAAAATSFVASSRDSAAAASAAVGARRSVRDAATESFGASVALRMSSSAEAGYGMPTELPDSLDDAAEIAAEACAAFSKASGPTSRCRVDFDTSVGDETFTTLKASTEFMQKFASALCYALVPGLMERRQGEMMRVAQARAELRALRGDDDRDGTDEGGETDADAAEPAEEETKDARRRGELARIIAEGGRDPENARWEGPKARIYFPDEGSAALARRDWKIDGPPDQALVPPCVEFSSCGGVQLSDISDDRLVFFFCPRASEAEFVEEILYRHEETCSDGLALTVFVNPLLVDMGVTGFGMAGRMLRERLIDRLTPTYYLRTLQWGALTRVWPRQFTVWQEDADEADGYRMIKSMDRLPSNPEVEDIYDIENGMMQDPEKNKGFGFLDGLGDFVNGMTRL